MARERMTVTLPENLIGQLDRRAEESGLNRSQQVEQLLAEALSPAGAAGEFILSTEVRGRGDRVMPMVHWFTGEDNNSTEMDLGREWVVRFYAEVKEGDDQRLFGSGMSIVDDSSKARKWTTGRPVKLRD